MNPAEYENLSVEQFKAKFGVPPTAEQWKVMSAAKPTNEAWQSRTPVPMKIGASVPAPQSTPQGEATPAPYKMPNDAANRNTQQMLKDWGSRVNGPTPFPTAPIGNGAAPVLPVTPPAPADESWQGKLKSAFGIGQEKTTPLKPSGGAGWSQDPESLVDKANRNLGIIEYKDGKPIAPATTPKAAPTPAPTAPVVPAVPPIAPAVPTAPTVPPVAAKPVAPVLPAKPKPADNPAVQKLKAQKAPVATGTPSTNPLSVKQFPTGKGNLSLFGTETGTTKTTEEQTAEQLKEQIANMKTAREVGAYAAEEREQSAESARMGTDMLQRKAGEDKAEQVKGYLAQLDANQRAEFWQGLIHSLGKITAGVVGRAQGADVSSHYKPISVFNVDTANKAAKERLGVEAGQTNERMQQAVENLKAMTQLQGESNARPYLEQQKFSEQMANLPGTKTEKSTATDVKVVNEGYAPLPKAAAAAAAGAKRTREDILKETADINDKWLKSNSKQQVPNESTPQARANQFALQQWASGLGSAALAKLYSIKERQYTNPSDAAKAAIAEIERARDVPLNFTDDVGRKWLEDMQEYRNNGIDFLTIPDDALGGSTAPAATAPAAAGKTGKMPKSVYDALSPEDKKLLDSSPKK